MKKFVLLSVFGLLMLQSAFCQNGILKMTSWTILTESYMDDDKCSVTSYEIKGDTTINNLKYKKLYCNDKFKGAVRETQDSLIYYYDDNVYNRQEYLLYDFSWKVGKVLYSIDLGDWDPVSEGHPTYVYATIDKIDTVTLENGEKCAYISTSTGEKCFQGIGDTEGFTAHLNRLVADYRSKLWCAIEKTNGDDILVYKDEQCKDCYTCNTFSFLDDGLQWSYIVQENSEHWVYKTPSIKTYIYRYFGDTVINRLTYKKMFRSSDNGKTWDEIGYFGQERTNVYYIPKGETEDRLAYSFSDNMAYRPQLSNYGSELELTSDIITINSVQKKRWGFYYKKRCDENEICQPESLDNKYAYEDIIIEGIGSIFAPTFDTLHFCPGSFTGCPYITSLLCVQKNGDVIWHNPNFDECYYERTATESLKTTKISLSQNPVKDKLTLTLPNAENQIKIFDLQGKLLLQQNVGSSAEINVSMLPAGTYVLVVNNSERLTFIKQ